jgi:hypothetical protein
MDENKSLRIIGFRMKMSRILFSRGYKNVTNQVDSIYKKNGSNLFMKYIVISIIFSSLISNTFSQVIVKDTSICKGASVQIGSKNYDPTMCYTWSPDNGTLSDKKSPNPIATPLVTTTYKLTVTGSNFSSLSTDSVVIRVKQPKVLFQEYEDQKYGFDGYSNGPGSPWKSLQAGDNDQVKINITPGEDFTSLFYSYSKNMMTVTPNKPTAATDKITLQGMAPLQTELQVNCGSENGDNVKELNVCILRETYKTVGLVLIVEENDDAQVIPVGNGLPNQIAIIANPSGKIKSIPGGDDVLSSDSMSISTGPNGICETKATGKDSQQIPYLKGKPNQICVSAGNNGLRNTIYCNGDDAFSGTDITTGPDGICNTYAKSTNVPNTDVNDKEVADYLNLIYKQAAIKWTVFRLPPCVVNYDLDADGWFDADSESAPGDWTDEEQAIIDKCAEKSVDYNVFLVDNPNDVTLGGISGLNQPYAFVFPGPNIPEPAHCAIAHELGHCLNLDHSDEADEDNLMNPFLGIHKRLRYNQWKILNPSAN